MRELDSLLVDAIKSGNASESEIKAIEEKFVVRLPNSYRQFLKRYGSISISDITIFGLAVPDIQLPSLVYALQVLRAHWPDVPTNLVPIESLSSGEFACLWCDDATVASPVVYWNLNIPTTEQLPTILSPDFTDYLYERLMQWNHREIGLQRLESHVKKFEDEYLKNNKLPRNHIWRPYRFCVQDVVLGLVVVRHSLANNCLEVDVCLISDVPEYERGSGVRMTSAFLLSEAYKCGGTMEIRFTENVEDGTVPRALQTFAQDLGVELKHIAKGRITPAEARQLYMALTEFSDPLRAQIDLLSQQGKFSQERACYVVHHGIWTRSEVESIVFGSLRPDGIFSGNTPPEQRHLYMQEILHARAAILGGFLDRRLARRERIEGTVAIDLEDDVRRLDIAFNPVFYAKIYRCDEELPISWVESQSQEALHIPAGHRLIALVRARDTSDLALHFQQDLAAARELAVFARQESVPGSVFILTPRDFQELSREQQDRFVATARSNDVSIIVCPETIVALDADAAKRLASSRILR